MNNMSDDIFCDHCQEDLTWIFNESQFVKHLLGHVASTPFHRLPNAIAILQQALQRATDTYEFLKHNPSILKKAKPE